MFKAFIFDVDGTIIDTELAMLNSLQQTLQNEKNIKVSHDDIRFVLGIPGKDALRMMGHEPVEKLHKIWSDAVLDFSHDVSIFKGMRETLDFLFEANKTLAIVTSKTKQSMRDEFDHFNLNSYFKNIIDADDTIQHKPHPEPLLQSIKNLELEAKDAIYIGDSIYDMQSAHKAGMKFGLALWGAKSTEKFKDADYVFSEPRELLDLIY